MNPIEGKSDLKSSGKPGEPEIIKSIVLDTISELVAYQDTGLRILWVNKAAAESVKKKPEELIGKHCYEVWPGHKKPCVGCPVLKSIKTGKQETGEITTPDGRVWIIRGYPVKENERVVGAVETTLEITEQRKTEERYRSLVELAPGGIIGVDIKGNVTTCNQAFVELTGYSKDDIIGKNFVNLPTLRKRDIPKYIKLFASITRGKTPGPFEFEWVRKDGSIRIGDIRIGIIKKDGKITGIQAVIRDVTDRKKAEEDARKRTEELERINRLSIGREVRMSELKKRMEKLEALLKKQGISEKDVD
jgi:PAS domain S-box-containing protein